MTARRNLAATVHDAIDDVTKAVEDIHKSIADLPLEVLGDVTTLHGPVDEVRGVQTRSIGAVYDLVRKVNHRVRQVTAGAAER